MLNESLSKNGFLLLSHHRLQDWTMFHPGEQPDVSRPAQWNCLHQNPLLRYHWSSLGPPLWAVSCPATPMQTRLHPQHPHRGLPRSDWSTYNFFLLNSFKQWWRRHTCTATRDHPNKHCSHYFIRHQLSCNSCSQHPQASVNNTEGVYMYTVGRILPFIFLLRFSSAEAAYMHLCIPEWSAKTVNSEQIQVLFFHVLVSLWLSARHRCHFSLSQCQNMSFPHVS